MAVERAESLLQKQLTPEAEAGLFETFRGGPGEERELSGAVAQRYASALADVALEHKGADEVKSDLASFVRAFYSSADLRNFLDNPSVDAQAQAEAIEKIAAAMQLSTAGAQFYLRGGRIIGGQGCSAKSRRRSAEELNARLGIAEAEVTSAVN